VVSTGSAEGNGRQLVGSAGGKHGTGQQSADANEADIAWPSS